MLKVKKQIHSSEAEKLAELWEKTDKDLARERIPNQDDWKNEDRQQGNWLHSNELVRRILQINPTVWAEDSINCPGHANFYYRSPNGTKMCAGSPFKKGPIREFSVVFVDRADRPIGVEYGWREVLRRLLARKLVSWEQILMHFKLYSSQRSEPFEKAIQQYKN
jgi:hypothetical protein